MGDGFYLVIACVIWAGVGQRAYLWWRDRRNHALGALLVSNATGGIGFTALFPPIGSRIEEWTGVAQLGGTVFRCLLMVCFATAQITFMLMVFPAATAWARARPRVIGYALATAAMIALFVLVRIRQPDARFDIAGGARSVPIALHLLLFYAGWAFDVIEIGRLSRYYARDADDPWLRRGLSVLAAGCWVGLGYPLHQTALLAATAFGARPGEQWPVVFAVIITCVVLVFAGLALPTAGPKIADIGQDVRRYRQYRRLHPLWRALYQTAPHIALDRPGRVDALTVRDLGFRLYRRVIEIRDGLLAVRDRLDPDVPDTARRLATEAGLTGDDLTATVEAAQIAVATRRGPRQTALAASPPTFQPPGATEADLSQEIEWLLQVARAYRHSPVIKAVVAQCERVPAGS